MAEEDGGRKKNKNKGNVLPFHGSEKTMNLNNMVYTNIISSPYFKNELFTLKTYHEVVDEIYYKVNHLEPWERGSRNLSNQVGMCGGVRGVGTGGIVSTAYCLLYKLFTLRLTRKQVNGLLTHSDSPYIRGLGFMYIRYTQPPADLWDWYESYLEDNEELDVRAGGGQLITIGELCETMLSKLEWFSTYFPRIPVPVQKDIRNKLENYRQIKRKTQETLRSRSYDRQSPTGRRSSDRSGNFETIQLTKNSKTRDRDRDRNRTSLSPHQSKEELHSRTDDYVKQKHVSKEQASESASKERLKYGHSYERRRRSRSRDRSRRSKDEGSHSSHSKKRHRSGEKYSDRDHKYSRSRDKKRNDYDEIKSVDKKESRYSLSKERCLDKSRKREQSSCSDESYYEDKKTKSSKNRKRSTNVETDRNVHYVKKRRRSGSRERQIDSPDKSLHPEKSERLEKTR
ncbi:Pre-mRNA-splicing factor 38B [Trichoplax sp. H2]|nr:Pre-mRNA-splicing factor 38B [Trichoplax sp. H2]|eukprot:RDD41140.1 Pre-mRNA-splicing factor 38B [Trichoplax sp. H2]